MRVFLCEMPIRSGRNYDKISAGALISEFLQNSGCAENMQKNCNKISSGGKIE